MAAQSLVLACLGLMAGQTPLPSAPTPSDTLYLNRRVLQIPLTFQEARRAEIKEILLFASPDQGMNWQQVAAAKASDSTITFNAPSDGVYWLRVASVNRLGKQEPDNIRVGPPDQKLVIDTLKPLLRFVSTERRGDEVEVAWELREDTPDWSSFHLEWQLKDDTSSFWTSVPATPAFTGKARFRPGAGAALTVRLSLKDLAGNLSYVTAAVAGNGLVPAGFKADEPLVPPSTFPPGVPPSAEKTFPPPLTPPPPSTEITMPLIKPAAPKDGAPWTTVPGSAASDTAFKPVASTEETKVGFPPITPPSHRALPAIQYFNRPEVPLEYELSKVGPSGVGSVDLYWTRDDGSTWEKYADDPALAGSTKTGRFLRTIELPGDGVFGFTIVITSRAGRGRTPPRPGEAPQMRVEIDSVPPVAQLAPPIPDTTRPNTLLLRWQAKDKNLTPRPISLEWAERRDGPWQPIALDIENTGQHSWTLPPTIPVQVYLRLRAKDAAGNESVAVTNEPQLVDLSEPEGRLLGISTPRP